MFGVWLSGIKKYIINFFYKENSNTYSFPYIKFKNVDKYTPTNQTIIDILENINKTQHWTPINIIENSFNPGNSLLIPYKKQFTLSFICFLEKRLVTRLLIEFKEFLNSNNINMIYKNENNYLLLNNVKFDCIKEHFNNGIYIIFVNGSYINKSVLN